MEKKVKKEKTTLQKAKNFKALSTGLEIGKYGIPVVTAGTVAAINWEEWWANCGVSLPFGLISLVIAIVVAVLAVMKKEDLKNSNVSPIIPVVLVMLLLGVAFMFLGNINFELGKMFLIIGASLIGTVAADEVEKIYAKPNLAFYNKLVEEHRLDPRAEKKRRKYEEAEQKARAEELVKEATE